jgi:hypothetical protein
VDVIVTMTMEEETVVARRETAYRERCCCCWLELVVALLLECLGDSECIGPSDRDRPLVLARERLTLEGLVL